MKPVRLLISSGVGVAAAAAVAVLLGAGCLTVPLAPEPPAPAGASAPTGAGVPLEVVPLQLGHNQAPRCAAAGQASCFASMPIVMGAYLVRHPKGTFLIDAGVASDGKADVARFSLLARAAVDYTPERTLPQALAAAGSPKIDFVVLTHAHWDHAGGLVDLPPTRVLVGPGEPEFVHLFPGDRQPVVAPRHFAHAQLETVRFDGPAYEGFPASHDLFGDGSVVLVPLGGHTPGSIAVFLTSVHGRRLLFVGDTAWSEEAIALPSHKLRPLSELTDVDPTALSASLWRLHQLRARDPGLLIVPAHDGRAMEKVRALSAAASGTAAAVP